MAVPPGACRHTLTRPSGISLWRPSTKPGSLRARSPAGAPQPLRSLRPSKRGLVEGQAPGGSATLAAHGKLTLGGLALDHALDV